MFTDGSKAPNGVTGAGWVIMQSNRVWAVGKATLGPDLEIYDAEADALRLGLIEALACPLNQHACNLWVCLDNQAIVDSTKASPQGSSQDVILKAQRLMQGWATRVHNNSTPDQAAAIWIPGRAQIFDNEVANKQAREAAGLPTPDAPTVQPPPLTQRHIQVAPRAFMAGAKR